MKRKAFVLFILVLLTEMCFPLVRQTCEAKNPGICFLDTSLTFYVVSIPDPMCEDGVECHSIYKIVLQKDSIDNAFPYKITGLIIGEDSKINNIGYLRQDLKTNKIIWKRIIYGNLVDLVELQDLAKQTQFIYSNYNVDDNDQIIPISQIVSEHFILNEIDKYFNFIVRIFSYANEPKEVIVDGKNSGIVWETVGGSSYQLLAVKLKDEFVYKNDYFQLYKKRINNN